MRIGIVGSCQVTGLAASMARLVPGATIDAWHFGINAESTAAMILPQLRGRDLVVTQLAPEGEFAPGALARASGGQVVFLPTVVFAGFHPDLTSLVGADRKPVNGLLGPLHSALIVAAYRLGIPAEQVPALFNALVFAAAGYLDVYELGRAIMLKVYAESGYDLGAALPEWEKHKPFMYTDNHPTIHVLDTLARMVLRRAGIEVAEVEGLPEDSLAGSIVWPIHPPVARRHGIEGSSDPVLPEAAGAGSARVLPMPQYVHHCYKLYAATPGIRYDLSLRVETATEALQALLPGLNAPSQPVRPAGHASMEFPLAALDPEEWVVWAFRLLLGRNPESRAVVDTYARNCSRESLIRDLVGSTEFAARAKLASAAGMDLAPSVDALRSWAAPRRTASA